MWDGLIQSVGEMNRKNAFPSPRGRENSSCLTASEMGLQKFFLPLVSK